MKDESKEGIYPLSYGVAYGFGLFETIKVHNKKLIFLEEHVKRLTNSCNRINTSFSYKLKDIERYSNALINSNLIVNGALKLLYIKNKDKFDLVISINDKTYSKKDYLNGFSLSFTNFKKNPYSLLTYLKSNNYMENLLARNEALNKGYDEVLFLNVHDKICEGAISNIFFIKENIVFTPSNSCGILEGIARNKVISLCNKFKIKIVIGEFSVSELIKADEVFVTNSLMDIMPVSKIENITYHNREMTNKLAIEYYKYFYNW